MPISTTAAGKAAGTIAKAMGGARPESLHSGESGQAPPIIAAMTRALLPESRTVVRPFRCQR